MSRTALYRALSPSSLAACPALPWANPVQDHQAPFSARARFIWVGSPTMAESIGGKWGNTDSIPFGPEISSSAVAAMARL